jgi:hypothetical protein
MHIEECPNCSAVVAECAAVQRGFRDRIAQLEGDLAIALRRVEHVERNAQATAQFAARRASPMRPPPRALQSPRAGRLPSPRAGAMRPPSPDAVHAVHYRRISPERPSSPYREPTQLRGRLTSPHGRCLSSDYEAVVGSPLPPPLTPHGLPGNLTVGPASIDSSVVTDASFARRGIVSPSTAE